MASSILLQVCTFGMILSTIYTRQKEMHTVRFVKLKWIKYCWENNAWIFVSYIIDKYLDLQNCMQNLFFFNCMYLLWALALRHCLRKGIAVHLYQHTVYAFCAFLWKFYEWNVKNSLIKFEPIFWTKLMLASENSILLYWHQCFC